MYHTCLRIVVNAADAEDILQDAFMEAFANLGRLKNKDAFAGWVKKIVINKSLNFIQRKKDNWVELGAEEFDDRLDDGLVDEQEFNLQVEAVKDAINQLPIKFRTVINLHVFEKMSFEEIAVLLEMPPSTLRSQYLRAKQKILTMVLK
jgi:RNA polymerase sigma-70 factor (ECF subfamily)